MANRWPRYEAVKSSTGVNVSAEHIEVLNRAELPKRFLDGDLALEEPVGIDLPGYGYLIRFAEGRGSFYFDPATGGVLYLGDWPSARPRPVNSSLDQYTRTVKALINAFPFYHDFGMDANDVDVDTLCADYEASAARLADRIRAIDPAALVPDGYWAAFLTDVMYGNYATEDILGERIPDPVHPSSE